MNLLIYKKTLVTNIKTKKKSNNKHEYIQIIINNH